MFSSRISKKKMTRLLRTKKVTREKIEPTKKPAPKIDEIIPAPK